MNIKKIFAASLACALSMSFLSLNAVLAADTGSVYNSDEETISDLAVSDFDTDHWQIKNSQGSDTILPATTFYVSLGSENAVLEVNTAKGTTAISNYLANTKYFSFKAKKETNSKYVKSITVEGSKRMDNGTRGNYLKFVLADYLGVDDVKTDGKITFTAKNSATKANVASAGNTWLSGDVLTIDYTLWLSNDAATNDDTIDAGDRVYFTPQKNDTNTLIWGGERDLAMVRFESDNDASKFYARMSTKVADALWDEYDDTDAELWCYDFINHPTMPSTSRGVLVLGKPWSEDAAYAPDPDDCFIYSYADGELEDITDSFTYSEDDEEIPGWWIKTRTLGTYIISDTELDTYNTDDEDEPVVDDSDIIDDTEVIVPANPVNPIPSTGSSDMVNVAVVAAIVSLAAAGAVAFRKAK